MENKNTGMKVAIIILSILVVGLTSYIVYDKVLNHDNTHIEENKDEEIINNESNQVVNNNTNIDHSININKLYNIGKSYYNFIKREYTGNSSFNLSTDLVVKNQEFTTSKFSNTTLQTEFSYSREEVS